VLKQPDKHKTFNKIAILDPRKGFVQAFVGEKLSIPLGAQPTRRSAQNSSGFAL
jgi:hypothetical protein